MSDFRRGYNAVNGTLWTDTNYEIYFLPIEGSTCSTMESTATEEQKEHNRKVREKAHELQEAEWNEFMDILRSDLRNYWT